LRFGRRWKAIWLKRKELENAKQRLRSLEEQPVSLVAVQNEKQPNSVPIKSAATAPEVAINSFQDEMHDVNEEKVDDTHELSSQVPEVDEPKEHSHVLSTDARMNSPELSLTSRNADTDVSDPTNKTIVKDDWPGDRYVNTLADKFREKFIADPEKGLQEPEHTINPDDSEDIQRLQQNWCSYEVLGECYVHGMMDGEAMAYQNGKGIRAQIFELR
jgi:hypothetical protein